VTAGRSHRSGTALNGDVQLAWEAFGEGPPVMLVHGLGYDRQGWGPAPGMLAERFTVVLFDNRGVGESAAPPGPYSTAEMAHDAAAVLDAAGFEAVHLIGTSLGGMIAQTFALTWPERVVSLVLSATTHGGPEAVPMSERSAGRFAAFAEDPSPEHLRGLVENSLSEQTVRLRPSLVDEIYAYRLQHPPRLEPWLAQAAAATSFASREQLGDLAVPTLLTHGTDDHVVDVRNSELLLRAIPHAEFQAVEGTGHLSFWEEPAVFAGSVSRFLSR
jgi:pimeloyl-ACP methyl ester carboxylesterase